ncbi:hypothetical protein L596_009253 [Steinernema carpocapsae]|uniref:Uncharacterized protein n=1 Tax=Steinernema carpocapsae TaxID=34508 RepID=A0A4U5PF36_STECR|nr:hypothetical protein L596_009253 [Steinernema carpocapsae]
MPVFEQCTLYSIERLWPTIRIFTGTLQGVICTASRIIEKTNVELNPTCDTYDIRQRSISVPLQEAPRKRL